MLPPWLVPYQQQFGALLARQQLAHGILLSGPEGIGKHLLANWLAATLLCTANSEKPCAECKSCLLRQAGSHADMLMIDSSGSTIGVDAVRQLSQFMQGRAQQQQNKVVLLPCAEKLTEAAANALLKTLEEPPQNSYLILTSSAATTLAATLLSRCQQWSLALETGEQTVQWLARHSSRAVPDFLLTYCGGGPLKALTLLESGDADSIVVALQALSAFFSSSLALTDCIKQLDAVSDLTALFGWFIRQQLLPASSGQDAQRVLAIHQLYSRWCRDAAQILGQNKQLALTALLVELKRLQG
jgi:DNA polymerase III subunit delta'